MTTGRTASLPMTHPVAHSLIRPLTVLGVERRLFFLALLTGVVVFDLCRSLLGGLMVWLTLTSVARIVTARDPQMLEILLQSSSYRRRYDAAKRANTRTTKETA